MLKISGHLKKMFNTSISIRYYSTYFKQFIIVIFYKQGDIRDFTSPKSYWPINFMNMIEIMMETVLAAKINFMITMHNHLFQMYFKRKCGSFIEITIYYLLNKNLHSLEWEQDYNLFYDKYFYSLSQYISSIFIIQLTQKKN